MEYVIILDEDFSIVSAPDEYKSVTLENVSKDMKLTRNAVFSYTVNGVASYCMFSSTEGHYIVGILPQHEAVFSRNLAVYITVFMEIIIFAALFINVYFLIKKHVVNNIKKVNESLAQITSGNLDVRVDVRVNEEFASLSDDINETVTTLKHYISEAAARIDKELDFAKQIQHSALPSVFPPFPDRKEFDLYAIMDTAKEVGGDFYDFYWADKNKLVFLVADVSGKGIPAAMFMMTAKTHIKNLTESGMDIAKVFCEVNRKLCENNDAMMFVTAWMGSVDLETGKLSYVNAGHNPPLIRHINGDYEYIRTKPNFVLAGMDKAKYTKHEMQLLPGDELFLYTDGVTEATDTQNCLFGEKRLLSSLNKMRNVSPDKICNGVKISVDDFVGEAPQFDDITMLSIRLNKFNSEDTITTFPDLASVADVTDFLDRKTANLRLSSKTKNRIQVCIDEIYSNIMRYSGATVTSLSLSMSEKSLMLTFQDNGTPYDPTQVKEADTTLSADEREIGGLGIHMVRKMSSSMAYQFTDGNNVLTLTFLL